VSNGDRKKTAAVHRVRKSVASYEFHYVYRINPWRGLGVPPVNQGLKNFLLGPEGIDYVHMGRPRRRENAADETHDNGKDDGLDNDIHGQGELKGQLGEGLEIDR